MTLAYNDHAYDDHGRGPVEAAVLEVPAQRMADDLASVCVVVPTRNEGGNVEPLVSRLTAAFGGRTTKVVFVDDSDDDTPQRIQAVARRAGLPVLLLHRERPERVGGLGSAVLSGLRAAGAEGAAWAVVMDGDLQHPPEVAPRLVAAGETAGADVVVGSRYAGSGSAAGLDGISRVLVSGGATVLSKAAFPRRLRHCSDPMSGFFAVRLASLDLDRLRPQGFKILLEILARSGRLRVTEQSFTFAERNSGESKASWREGLTFVKRLLGLRLATAFGKYSRRLASVVGFATVGASGIVVNSLALWALVTGMHIPLLIGATVATQVSTTWNFLLTDRFVFPGGKRRPGWQRFLGFAAINNVVLLLRLPLLSWLVVTLGSGYLAANFVSLLVAFAVRFVVADLFLFTPEGEK